MSDTLDIEIAELDLIKQVFDRQKQHLAAIQTYVKDNCAASGAFGVGVLAFVEDDYRNSVEAADQGYTNGRTIAETCSTKATETKQDMVEADRRAYERYAAQQRALGHDVPPYTPPPGGGDLPAAGQSATPGDQPQKPWKIPTLPGDFGKKVGEYMSINPNDPWARNPASGPDPLDPKYWGRRGVEGLTDAGRGYLGLDGPGGRHRAPLPTWPEDVASTTKNGFTGVTSAVSAVNNFAGIIQAGQAVQNAQAVDEAVDDSASGPKNDSGITWANGGGSGW